MLTNWALLCSVNNVLKSRKKYFLILLSTVLCLLSFQFASFDILICNIEIIFHKPMMTFFSSLSPRILQWSTLRDIDYVVKSAWVNDLDTVYAMCNRFSLLFFQATHEFSTASKCHDRHEQWQNFPFSILSFHTDSYCTLRKSHGIILTLIWLL